MLDRTIPLTERAKAYIDSLPHSDEKMVWVVRVYWDRGDADNKRSPSGEVVWRHSGPRGWRAELGGYYAKDVTPDWGQPVAPGIYVDVFGLGQPFPGGVVDFENGDLVLKPNAV
jgi:hypothetical protein